MEYIFCFLTLAVTIFTLRRPDYGKQSTMGSNFFRAFNVTVRDDGDCNYILSDIGFKNGRCLKLLPQKHPTTNSGIWPLA